MNASELRKFGEEVRAKNDQIALIKAKERASHRESETSLQKVTRTREQYFEYHIFPLLRQAASQEEFTSL